MKYRHNPNSAHAHPSFLERAHDLRQNHREFRRNSALGFQEKHELMLFSLRLVVERVLSHLVELVG
jgi:hypothetical protein